MPETTQNKILDIFIEYLNIDETSKNFISKRASNPYDINEFFAESFVMNSFSEQKSVFCVNLFKAINSDEK